MRDKTPPKDSPYTPEALNEYGDVEAYNLRQHREDKDWEPDIWGGEEFQMGVVEALTELKEHCEQNNATLLIIPPVYKAMNYDENEASINKVWNMLEKNGLPIVSNPERYRMADSLHYDSEYHLTFEGVQKRTELVIEDIDRSLTK